MALKLKTLSTTLSALALSAAIMPAAAQAQDTSVSVGVDYVTEYVFRGASLADQAIQPYAEVTHGNFTAGIWASLSEGDGTDIAGDEVDLYGSYSIPLSGQVSLDAGFTYYHYPQNGDLFETDGGNVGNFELFLSAGFDAPFEPSLTAYYDLTLESFTLEGAVSHSVPISEVVSLDLGANAVLVNGDGFSYEYVTASAALSYAISEATSVYVGGNVAFNSEDVLGFDDLLAGRGESEMVWFGAGISTGF